jgi:hypothetical protein
MFDLRAFFVSLAILLAAAALLGAFTGLRFGPAVAIVFVAMALNGIAAVVEDDLPGGMTNLDGNATPAYVVKLRSRIWIGLVSLGAALVAATWLLERVA